MICPHCGELLPDSASFCRSCGTRVSVWSHPDPVAETPRWYVAADCLIAVMFLFVPMMSVSYGFGRIDLGMVSLFGYLADAARSVLALASYSADAQGVSVIVTVCLLLLIGVFLVLPVVRLARDIRCDLLGEPTKGSGAATVALIGALARLGILLLQSQIDAFFGSMLGLGGASAIISVTAGWWATMAVSLGFLLWRHTHGRRIS